MPESVRGTGTTTDQHRQDRTKAPRWLRPVLTLIATAAALPAAAQSSSPPGGFDPLPLFAALERYEIVGLTLTLALLLYAVFASIILLRIRGRMLDREERLQRDVTVLRAEADRYQALLIAEPQIIISWRAGDDLPSVIGDPAIIVNPNEAPHVTAYGDALRMAAFSNDYAASALADPLRITAFGSWLAPEPAMEVERAVDLLRARGEGFSLILTTLAGRSVEATGRAISGQAIVRLRDLSGARRELAEIAERQQTLIAEAETLRAFIAQIPWPVWARDAAGQLIFANPAYARLTHCEDSATAVARNAALLERADGDAVMQTLARGEAFARRLPVVIDGARMIFDVRSIAAPGGSAGIAIDVTEAAGLAAALEHMAQAHRRTLDQLPTAVAIFDADRRLAFSNQSYRQLWNLDLAFLAGQPTDSALLDRLRAARKLPEEQDFRQWKARLHEAYHALEPREHTWHLPDGRTLRIVTTPNNEGGVTYLIDDVSERLAMARRFDTLIRMQRETLDNLTEGVAVFASNGRVNLYNPAFAKIWRLSAAELDQQPHIETLQQWCRPLCDDDEVWAQLRGAITTIEDRPSLALQLQLRNGNVFDCQTMPLPDGATLVTFEDVTDTFNVERALRERNDALEAADKIKIDFVHHVSYELRSPLTTIIGFAHFLADPATGTLNPKQSEYLAYITTSTNALLALINDILDLASIDAGAMVLDVAAVDIASAIEQAAGGVQDRLVKNHIMLRLDVPTAIGSFMADEKRVVQVLYNLFANAARFSPEGAAITVTARRSEEAVTFAVTDQGPGIPPEARDRVFNWFESEANGSGRRGTGLGLTLVRYFVELHGGHVTIDSPVGGGTTVTCAFPVDCAAARTAAE